MSSRDPYQVLGVGGDASDEEVRSAYRRLVQLHHPDHNGGSPESARRFEEVQEAYQHIRRLRESGPTRSQPRPSARQPRPPRRPPPPGSQPPPPPPDPAVDARLADLERQVRKASERARREADRARERARRAARDATAGRSGGATDEELGHVTTEDSFSKILSDARGELAGRFSQAREHPVVKRVSDLIDGLDELASKLDEDRRKRRR
jgi:type IV secretory pathway VirB10-like protein